MEESHGMHDDLKNMDIWKGAITLDFVFPPSFQMDYNIKLEFDFANSLRSEIYHDLMEKYVYKIGKIHLPPRGSMYKLSKLIYTW